VLARTTILALALSASSLPSSGETRATLENTTPAELCPTCTKLTILIKAGNKPIQLTEQPKVEAVLLGGDRIDRDDSGKFAAKWIGSPQPRAIELSVDTDALARAGTYDVYLNLQPQSDPGADRLKLQITHPAPKIAAIPKLIIDQTYYFIGWSDATHPELTVNETSKKSNVTKLTINRIGNTTIGNKLIGGTLEFPSIPEKIAAGNKGKTDYRLANDFDLGTATGSLKLDAAEVLDPLGTVDFEVRSHVHWIYIGLTIALGLLCSYWLKVRLQQKLELDQARLDGQKLVERVSQEGINHLDNTFRRAYEPALRGLRQALAAEDPQAINASKTDLDTIWRSAIQSLAFRHQEVQVAFDKLRDVTNYDWSVPPSVFTHVAAARDEQTPLPGLIQHDDLDSARQQLNQILMNLGQGVRQAALLWQSGQTQVLEIFLGNPAGVSQAISAVLTKPAQELSTALSRVTPPVPVATPEQIQQVLSDIRVERISVVQFFTWVKNVMATELAKAEALITDAHLTNWDSATFSILVKALDRFSMFLASMIEAPAPPELSASLADVHNAWTSALQSQFPSPRSAVQNALDSRDYIEATRAAIREKRGTATALGGLPVAGAPFSIPGFQPTTSTLEHTAVYAVHSHFQMILSPLPAVPTSVTNAQQLKRDKRTQTVVIGIVLIALGYGLQLNTFVGTFTDFSTLFFWAFGLDLTLDALKTASRKTG